MCGIVGLMTLGKLPARQEKLRQESMIFLSTELLQLTQARGTDATGVSVLFNDGNFTGLKMGVSSPEFISRFGGTKLDFEGFIKLWRENDQPVKTYLGHCRKTSIGSARDNVNNHPIKVGNVVGIHNGTLTNHDTIFKKLGCKRDGDVDSEAIIRMLHFYTKKGTEPFTVEMLKEVCLRLQGTYSVIAYNGDNPNQVVTFRDGKPNVVALIRPLNLLLMSSEESYIKQVLYRYNKHSKLFQPRIKFPVIKKKDIVFKTMVDDTAAVFNLENKPEEDADIDDFFESVKVFRADKKWKKATTIYRAGCNRQNHVTGNNSAANKVAETNKSKATNPLPDKTKTKDTEEVKGKIWNKDLKEFKDVDETQVESAKKIKSVEIDNVGAIFHIDRDLSDDDDVIDVKAVVSDDNKADGIVLKEVSKEKADGLIGNSSKITDEEVKYPGTDAIEVINPSTGKKPDGITVEVDTNVNPAAMEAATKAAAVQPKFETDEEVLEELGVDDKRKLDSLQLFALANRISKTLFKRSFYNGYIEAENAGKIVRAENNIKTLKTVAKVFMKAFRSTSFNADWKTEYVKKAIKDEKDITIAKIQKVFSAGDIRDNPELQLLQENCSE